MRKFYEEGGIIIANRYTTAQANHQCLKLPREKWSFLKWLFDFEYKLMGISAPDVSIYLQAYPVVSQKLMTGCYHGDKSEKDIHENNLEYLARSRQTVEYCAKELGWVCIQCTENEWVRSVAKIREDVKS